MIVLIAETRHMAQRGICEDLPLLGMPQCTAETPCQSNYDEKYMGNLTCAFGLKYWPPRFTGALRTVAEAVATIKRLGPLHRGGQSCAHTGRMQMVTRADLAKFAARIEEMCHGLCVKCVKEGGTGNRLACHNQEHA